MKWFNNWLYKKFKHMWENRYLYEETVGSPEPTDRVVSSGNILHSRRGNGLNFQIYGASGGYVLECSHYDDNTDKHYQNLHVIANGEDLGESISKIITIEMLRR
jgi:hypothetical protein